MKLRLITVVATLVISLGLSAQSIDMSLIPYRSDAKWGFANPDGKIMINPKYDDVQWFSEGFAAVKLGTKWGYINKSGALVIPARYTVAKSFRKGFVPSANKDGGDSVLFAGVSLKADGYENCIDTKGRVTVKCPAIAETSVPENNIPVATAVQQKTYSVPNNNGLFDKIVDDYKIAGSEETYYIAQKNGLYGVFNTKFETIVPFEYDEITINRRSNPNYLSVKKNGLYGIATTLGQVKVMPDNTSIATVQLQNGKEYIIVKKDGKTYVKDMDNNLVIPDGYADIVYEQQGGFVIKSDDQKQGFYFLDNTFISPKYSEVHMINGTDKYLLVKTFSGKTGYISSSGNEYFVE